MSNFVFMKLLAVVSLEMSQYFVLLQMCSSLQRLQWNPQRKKHFICFLWRKVFSHHNLAGQHRPGSSEQKKGSWGICSRRLRFLRPSSQTQGRPQIQVRRCGILCQCRGINGNQRGDRSLGGQIEGGGAENKVANSDHIHRTKNLISWNVSGVFGKICWGGLLLFVC